MARYTLHRFYNDGGGNPSIVDYGEGLFQASSLEDVLVVAQQVLGNNDPQIQGVIYNVAVCSSDKDENILNLGAWGRACARILYVSGLTLPRERGQGWGERRRRQSPPATMPEVYPDLGENCPADPCRCGQPIEK